MNKKSRSSLEMQDKTSRPEIANKIENMKDYDIVFVGFPIWWYVAPTIIHTFLESYDFSNKIIIPFCTSGGSGVGNADEELHALLDDTVKWFPCKLLNHTNEKEIQNWIDTLNL